ncbi:hypothetical protein C9374_001720 [Naegleria lovaniensis]|uniref:RNase H type-1 domain-containing protein n=1 Tax=Naegleria lovaniensis TaxID=51637 RepID=A0AA88GXA4_NAELO|nr:uncharacterized protein C9374_001720 [Naegleria lovaniensis]KAG2387388.1 hypothetical protein C9374_001720 [Naegleria lovaniensis]
MTPKIKGTVIPLEPNLRVLGHYPWSDRIVNADVNDKIEKLRLSLKYLPVRRLEPLNLKKVIHAKAISLFTHLSKTNFISKKHLESINSSIRSAIKRRMLIDVRTPSGFFHLPTTLSGLDIPSIVEFIEHIHLRTLMLMANQQSHQKSLRLRNVASQGQYNISVQLNNQQFSLPQLSGTNFEIHTDGSRQNGKSGMGINIYDHSHTPKLLHSHSLRIHDGYSHNIAELASILTSIHLIPNRSKATIHTDSQVAIQALKKNYRGRFLLFYREFQKIIRARSLQISLKKVKGHKDPENIKVDALARQSLSQPTIFDIRQLFGKQRLLTKTDIIIFNQREMTQTFHHKKMTTKLDDNPNLIDHVH